MRKRLEGTFFKRIIVSWFSLTDQERRAVLLMAGLFFIGVMVRLWTTLSN
ncbi:MAG: hypothetical protein ACI9OU_001981 [Candidatus Promineifilaceae bacterium]|jgi:hypothetical protein